LCNALNILRAISLTLSSIQTTFSIATAIISTHPAFEDRDREARDLAARGGQHIQRSASSTHHQAGMPSSATRSQISARCFRSGGRFTAAFFCSSGKRGFQSHLRPSATPTLI
jgi:hypothetical protein